MQDIEQTEQELTALLVRIIRHYPQIADEWKTYYPPDCNFFDAPRSCAPDTEGLTLSLKHHGFEFVGSGCYGLVLRHPDTLSTVYKISARLNDAYGAFALYARQMQGDPHLPVIRDLQSGAFFMVVALEELERLEYEYDDLCMQASSVALLASRGEDYDYGDFDEYEDLLECAASIGTYFAGSAQLDLHNENIMQRMDGTLVITDPVSNTKG